MAKTSLSAIGFCGAMLFGFAVHAADTWFVKAANFGKEGLDGRTEETAWGTLQDAHDNAAAGDTVKVLEGIYDKGENYCSYSKRTNRLVVAKKLFFEAVGSRDNTHIVGKISTVKEDGTASADGRGADGMRCVSVVEKGWGSTFTGFTFRDGSTSDDGNDPKGNDGKSGAGGGAITVAGGSLTSLGTYFIDCVISNCVGTWGAAMRGGTGIRCFIVNNSGSSFGGVCCTVGLWNSVVVGVKQLSSDRPACGNECTIVNSTIAATSSRGYNRFGRCYNTLFTSCGDTAMGLLTNAKPSYYNCTNTATGVFSPATWDFRPVAGMEAHNNGKTSYVTDILTLPEGIEMKDFNGNPIDLTKETCDIGAVQGAVENASGAVVLPLGTLVDGVPVPLYKTTYARTEEWPNTLVLKPTIEKFFSYEVTGDRCGGPTRRFLQLDGTHHMLPPPFVNQTITLANKTYLHEYWCSPDADASVATGTQEKPFCAVQDAIVAATNAMAVNLGPAVVNLLPGEYREGGAFDRHHNNRIVVPSGKAFLIRSTEGAARTIVYGQADPNPVDDCYAGCGPNAMRCASMSGDTVSALQGITFADGHSNFASSTSDAVSDQCGGIFANNQQILDCVVTNCTAVRGACSYYGQFNRCRFYDSVSYSSCFRYGKMSACYVDPSCRNGSKPAGVGFSLITVIGSGMDAVMCTAPVGYTQADCAYSTMFGSQKVNNVVQWGSVFRSATGYSDGAKGYAVQDPRYVDFENNDLRLMTGTPALEASAEAIGERGSESWGKWASNITSCVQSDVNGARLKVVDGKLMPGCFHETVDGVYIANPKNGGVSIGESSYGKVVKTDELPVIIEMVEGTRPCIGFAVNGVTNRFDDAQDLKITFSAADVASAGGGIFAEAIYTKDWYVDPNGDDANFGFTPRSAKKTLAAAMAKTQEGDTVHAAEGRYEEGFGSEKSSDNHPESRVYIPKGRTLVADGDVSRTFIVGRRGTDEYTDELGCGSNSVRCVYMMKNTLLKGFTLIDGHAFPVNNGSGDYGEPFNGGAIYGPAGGRDSAIVLDCVISNCAAYNYAAGREVSFVNCLITANKAKRGITSECYHFGCVIDGNYANTAALHMHTRVVDTTIGPNAFKLDGSAGIALGGKSTDAAHIVNSLILGKCNTGELKKTVSNCVFAAGMGTTVSITNNSWNCRFANADELMVDENLRPIAGRNVACDIADPLAGDSLEERLKDIYMSYRSRANNGNRLDVGALEADWRGRYAEDVGGYRFSVSAADNSVEESQNRTVLVPDGATLSGGWSNGSERSRTYLVRFKVPEGGALSIDVDGSVETFSEGLHEFRFVSDSADVPVQFASAGGTSEIMRGGWIRGTMMIVR